MSDLKQKTFAGVFWQFFEKIGTQLVSLIVSIILARILTPADYSVVSIVLIFFTFSNIFVVGGFNSALVQKKDADEKDYSSVFTLSMIVAFVLYVIIFVCAPWISKLYDKPVLVHIFWVMGLILFVNAYKSILAAYVSSTMQFKKFFFATLWGTAGSAIIGIVMALLGFGAWALVAQQLSNAIIGTIFLAFATKIKVCFCLSLQRIKVLLKYGWKVFASTLVTTTYNEINPLIIGIKFTPEDLAFYSKGKSYPGILNSSISNTITAVLFPAMVKVQDDMPKLLAFSRKYVQLASFLVFPILLGFFAISDKFITLILTDKWLIADVYMKIFCIVYMIESIQIGNVQAVLALGKSGSCLVAEIIKRILQALVIFLCVIVAKSPEVLALSMIINAVISFAVGAILGKVYIGYKFRMLLIDMLPNLLVSAIMSILVMLIANLNINKWVVFILQIVSGCAIYVILNIVIKNKNLKYIFNLLKEKFKK